MARDLSSIKPTTIDGIKRLATQIKKERGIKHHEALIVASRQAGYDNFNAARNALMQPNGGA